MSDIAKNLHYHYKNGYTINLFMPERADLNQLPVIIGNFMPFRLSCVALFLCCCTPTFATEQDEQLEESPAIELALPCQSADEPCVTDPKTPSANDLKEIVLPAEKNSAAEIPITELENAPAEPVWETITLLGNTLPINSKTTIKWYSGHISGGFDLATPVVVIHGKEPGPTVCLTAAVHGDEVNGVEIARRVVQNIKSEDLKGTLISVPVVNMDGLWRKDRYMSDRRDLNRAFPGDINGSTASRVAYSLFNNIISHCDSLIDLHSGSMYRENITQLRVDLTIPAVAEMAKQFGAVSVLQSSAPSGSLRGSATKVGIPTVVMEVGGPFTINIALIETAVKALRSYLSSIDILPHSFFWSSPQPTFYASQWLRSQQGGILINKVALGEKVNKGELLGKISNPVNDQVEILFAPFDAVVLGRAEDQFVSAGYAVYNLGKRSNIKELEQQGSESKKNVVKQNAQEVGLTITDQEATETTSPSEQQ
ncbi:MAG: putative deacylase [Psychromonas sp.]